MSTFTKTAVLACGLLIIVGIWLVNRHKPENTNPILIGSVLGITGDAAIDSLNIQRGMELARKDLLEQGITIDLRYEDDQTDVSKTVLATQRLISLYHPKAIIGFTWDFNLDAAAPVINSAGIPVYSPANTSGVTGTRGSSIFFGAPVNETKTGPIVAYLQQRNIRRVAIIVQESAWALNHVNVYTEAANRAGVEVVLVEKTHFGQEASSLPTAVAKANQARAEAVLWSGGQQGIVVLLSKMQEQGLDVPLIGEVGIDDVVANGLVRKTAKSDWLVFRTVSSERFVEKFTKEYGEAPGPYADIAYDGLMVLVEAIRNTDGTSETVTRYLREGKVEYKGYSNNSFRFDENGGIVGGTWYLDPVK